MAGRATRCTAGRVMEVTVDLVVVFVVTVVLAKYGRADGTCKVIWVVLFVCITISVWPREHGAHGLTGRGDVASSEGLATLCA